MVKSFLVSMFAILLFTLGGTAAWFYLRMTLAEQAQANAPESLHSIVDVAKPAADPSPVPQPDPLADGTVLPAVVRGPELDAEEMFRLATATDAKREQLRKYEERLRDHKLRIKAADADTKAAQREVEGTLDQVRNLMQATESLLNDTKLAVEELRKERMEVDKKSQDLQHLETEAGAGTAAKLKTFAEYMASMPAPDAAETVKEMANDGKMDFAIQLLQKMEPRNVSKILAEIRDPQMVAEIASRYTDVPTIR